MKKKEQKRLGNKGFSLVELIVVIAIMAVLVGVLAPTLIKNVERSRESTDLQNLDTIRGAVVTALSNEAVYKEFGSKKLSIDLGKGDVASLDNITLEKLKEELKDSITSSIKMKSSVGKDGNVIIDITEKGAVTVSVKKAGAVVDCKQTDDEDGNPRKMTTADTDTETPTTTAPAA